MLATQLVVLEVERRSAFEVGDLVTVEFTGGKRSGARILRIEPCTVFVKVANLNPPSPYRVGDVIPVNHEAVINW